MANEERKFASGFSLLELVIVVVILAVIAAIAIPRMSRGSEGAADSALASDLKVLRSAIDLYAAEHGGEFPGKLTIEDQLLQYTDVAGDAQAAKDATHIYGPYLRKVPPLPVGPKKGCTTIKQAPAAKVGWVYNETTGAIKPNTTTEMDAAGKLYVNY